MPERLPQLSYDSLAPDVRPLADEILKVSVEKRLNEFAILIQARISNAQYEWWAHEPIARKAGLSDAVMRDLQECRRPCCPAPT